MKKLFTLCLLMISVTMFGQFSKQVEISSFTSSARSWIQLKKDTDNYVLKLTMSTSGMKEITEGEKLLIKLDTGEIITLVSINDATNEQKTINKGYHVGLAGNINETGISYNLLTAYYIINVSDIEKINNHRVIKIRIGRTGDDYDYEFKKDKFNKAIKKCLSDIANNNSDF